MSDFLNSKTLEKIINILKKNPKIKKIILFGSRAKGCAKEGSDIDIAIVGNEITTKEILKLLVEIDELDLAYSIDLINYDSILNEKLKEHINRVGITIWSKNEQLNPIDNPNKRFLS